MDKITEYYNIHDIVKIKISTARENVHLEALVHLREFKTDIIEEEDLDIVIFSYEDRVKLENPIVISDYYYYENNWLDIPSKKICFNLVSKKIEVFCVNYQISINFLVQIILLRKGFTMIHSAAFSFNNKSYLIPTFGGVGKTITLSKFVDKGAKIFGDDLIIIKSDKIYAYPMDFSIYPYHIDLLNIDIEEANKVFKRTRVLNNIQNKFAHKEGAVVKVLNLGFKYIKKSFLPISPRRIFGDDVINTKGTISEVIYLLKQDIESDKLVVSKMNSGELANISTDILMGEWHGSFHLLQIYSGLSGFSIDSFKDKIREVMNNTFKNTSCNKVIIPTKISIDEYIKQFEDVIIKNK